MVGRSVDVSAISPGTDISTAVLSLLRPEVLFVDRSKDAIDARLTAAASQLCLPSVDGDVVRGQCPSGTIAAARRGSTLAVGWGDREGGPALPDATPGNGALSCGRGVPIASGRLNLAAIYEGTRKVGLLDAFSNGVLAAVYGLIAEYGGIMRVSQPVVGLACVQPDRRLTFEAHWRFQAQ